MKKVCKYTLMNLLYAGGIIAKFPYDKNINTISFCITAEYTVFIIKNFTAKSYKLDLPYLPHSF